MYRIFCFILFYFTLLSCQFQGIKYETSQWRGENRDGIYNETGLRKSWGEDEPELLWEYKGIGDGLTAPAVAGKKIYLTGLIDDKLVLHVVDIKGNLINKKEIGTDWKDGYPGPRSTLNVNDGKLYIYNAFGQLFCLDEKTLDEVWMRNIITDFDGIQAPWGATESPLIVDDKIIITPGGIQNNIIALNKNTGDLVWSSAAKGTRSAYCSPQFISGYSVPIIVTSMFDYIVGLNADTGEMLWYFSQKSGHDIHPNTPLYHNGMILSGIGWGGGSLMLRLTNGGTAVEQVWKNNEIDTRTGAAVRVGEYFYASGCINRYWFCVDWNTGEIIYRTRELYLSNLIYADGMLYCYTERGLVALVSPNTTEFEMISSFEVTQGTDFHFTHLVIDNAVLYVRRGDSLIAYNLKN
jgi:outer membrane protein assembly factor BamB